MRIYEVVEFWKNSKVNLNKGVTIAEIHSLEKHLDFKFPNDFKLFYLEINGFKDWDTNKHMFSIFSIERIKEEYEASDKIDFIPFCDYLINCYHIGFSKKSIGVFIKYNNNLGDFNDKVADSFEESIFEILNNSDKIY